MKKLDAGSATYSSRNEVSLSRNAVITIDTILMGTVSSAGSVEWIFMIGGFKK